MNDQQRYQKLAKRVREINAGNGWDKPTWENLPGKLAMVFTEINEAHEEFDPSASTAFSLELADIAIRLLDCLESVWPGQWTLRQPGPGMPGSLKDCGIAEQLWAIVDRVSEALEAWRHDNGMDTQICLEQALRAVREVSGIYGINLRGWIDVKLDRNAQRGYLHGKKNSEG